MAEPFVYDKADWHYGADNYDPELDESHGFIHTGMFLGWILDHDLYNTDWFMVAADFDAYAATQRDVDAVWRNSPDWYARAIRNVARVGWFSSDRTIRQYAKEIWNVPA